MKKYLFLILFTFLLFAASKAHAALSLVQATSTVTSSNVNSVSSTFSSAVTTGDLIVVSVGGSNDETISSITDNGSPANTYSQVTGAYDGGTDSSHWTDIWYAKNIGGNAKTVTVTLSGTATKQVLQLWEVSGADTSAPLDGNGVHGFSTTGSVDTGPTITTTNANDFLASAVRTNGNGISSQNDATFTLDTGNSKGGWSHAIVASTGSYTPKWNDSSASQGGASVAAFKAAGAPPPSSGPTPYATVLAFNW